jgi:hypothetical protein
MMRDIQVIGLEKQFCHKNQMVFPWTDNQWPIQHQVVHSLKANLLPQKIHMDAAVLQAILLAEFRTYATMMNSWDIRFQRYIMTHRTVLVCMAIGLIEMHTDLCLLPYRNEWRSF